MPSIRPLFVVACTLAVAPLAGRSEDAAAPTAPAAVKTIAAVDALDHVGDECIVEFTVKAARKLDDKEICFLNSRRDHREGDNFTAVIFRAGLARFAAEGIENPALEYLELPIRVHGVIEERSGKAQIVVENPAQIEVVEVEEPVGTAD